MKQWHEQIPKAQNGDIEAFTAIVREFQTMAVGYACSILGDFHLAEDAAQEAFLEAWRSLGDLREAAAFPGWLRKIVWKHCDRTTRRKQPRTVSIDLAPELPAQGADPRQAAEQTELQDRVLATILALPEDERLATTLFYINGYSMAEVGEFLEVPVSTVKNRLHSARSKLRERMIDMVESTLKQHAPGEDFTRAFYNAVKAGRSLADWLGEFPVLETEHLRLRELRPEEDGREWAAIRSTPVERTTKMLEGVRGRFYSQERVFSWAVTLKNEDRMIGFVRYWEYLYHPESPWGVFATLACDLRPDCMNTGLYPEALRAAARFGIEKIGFVRVQCSCSPDDEAAMREVEAAGFTREGTLRSWWFDQGSQRWQDEVMFSLVRSDLAK